MRHENQAGPSKRKKGFGDNCKMSIMRISKIIDWEMGHRLPNHESACFSPHGHHYKCEVVFEGEVVKNNESNRGMVIDFGEIKCILRALVVDPLDHAFMVKDDDPFAAHLAQFAKHIGGPIKIKEVPFDPTAEKIAEFIFQRVNKAIGRVKVVEVTVWETPSCKAVYRP